MNAESLGKISLSLGASKKPSRQGPTSGVKRSWAALHDHDEEEGTHGKREAVSHFDRSAGGAIDASKPVSDKKPLVIQPRANRDWKEASQRNKRQRNANLMRQEEEVRNGHTGKNPLKEDERPVYGLSVPDRSWNEDGEPPGGHDVGQTQDERRKTPSEDREDVPMREKTDEDRAVDALLGRQEKSGLVLPALTETEAFTRDYREAPDMATLEDYDRVPVEEFGAALLRGMGWKDGQGIGNQRGNKTEKTKLPERRPALLGIGAKEEAAVAQEMGTWGRAAKDRKGPQQVYNPVLLRDKRTGKLFTEEELAKRKEQEERERYEMQFEREEEKRKAKERRERARDESRDGEEERRRRDDRDRRRHDGGEEHYRRKEEKRRRERERTRRGSDYDQERSGKRDRDGERHRDRRSEHRR